MRLCTAVLAAAAALAWCCAAAPDPGASALTLLTASRIRLLIPLAFLAVLMAWSCGLRARAALALACALLALAWVAWSVAVRCALDASPALDALQAAGHERVWLTAAGISAVLFAARGGEQSREGSATFRRPLP